MIRLFLFVFYSVFSIWTPLKHIYTLVMVFRNNSLDIIQEQFAKHLTFVQVTINLSSKLVSYSNFKFIYI